MMLVRAIQRLLWFVTSPLFTWGAWFAFCVGLWWFNHELVMARMRPMNPEDFFAVALFLLIPTRLLGYLHRYTSLPAPIMRMRRGRRTKPVQTSLVRVAVPKTRRATSPGEARMRRQLPPRLQTLLQR